MKAIHVNSFAPTIAQGKTPKIEKFDLYNTVLSALLWRKHNGDIDLICDKASAEYYEDLGITSIWNNVQDLICEKLEGINPLMFWAAGKLLALREISAPVVMLDADFITWKKLRFFDNIIAAHREELYPHIYPEAGFFSMKQGYIFNEKYNYNELPLNTAFLYLPDEDFKQYYVSAAIDFMKSAQDRDDYLCYMVYAEQRLLAMCAEYLKQPVLTLLSKNPLSDEQNNYTHLWGAKQQMKKSKHEEANFRLRCAERIRIEFPEYEYVINLIEKE